MYKEAYYDASKLWNLMSPSEHRQNPSFRQEYVQELKVLAGHFEEEKPTESRIVLLKNKLRNISSMVGVYLSKHSEKLANFLALLCMMGTVTFLYTI